MNILTSLEIGYKKLKKIHSSYKIDSEILLSKTLNISREEMLERNLYDCVLGKALESGSGESYLLRVWITI